MALMVRAERLVGDGSDVELANRFLAHLGFEELLVGHVS